nr:shootin-1-like [Macaca fascicularis]
MSGAKEHPLPRGWPGSGTEAPPRELKRTLPPTAAPAPPPRLTTPTHLAPPPFRPRPDPPPLQPEARSCLPAPARLQSAPVCLGNRGAHLRVKIIMRKGLGLVENDSEDSPWPDGRQMARRLHQVEKGFFLAPSACLQHAICSPATAVRMIER